MLYKKISVGYFELKLHIHTLGKSEDIPLTKNVYFMKLQHFNNCDLHHGYHMALLISLLIENIESLIAHSYYPG